MDVTNIFSFKTNSECVQSNVT